MNTADVAVAVFVKTPGLSPIKTRLAATIGAAAAEEFYRLSVAAVEATVASAEKLANICPYWAIAEPDGMDNPLWKNLARLPQGAGDLGERLDVVFGHLKELHRGVILIGADAPQITAELLRDAAGYLNVDDRQPIHVLGRCHDGGFYLFGANYMVPSHAWKNCATGTSLATETLLEALRPHDVLRQLPTCCDVDRADDLVNLSTELREIVRPTAAQSAVMAWLKDYRSIND